MERIKEQLDLLNSLPYFHTDIEGKQKAVVLLDDIIKAMKPLKEELKEEGYIYSGGRLVKITLKR